MSQRTKKDEFFPMPRGFADGMRQMIAQQRATVQLKLGTALELNPKIPKDWTYNVDKGGFEPQKKGE